MDNRVAKPFNCVCDLGKFCKYHYSAIYYEKNKNDILKKQKSKYKEKKELQKCWGLSIGNFCPFGKGGDNPSDKLVVFFGRTGFSPPSDGGVLQF